MARRFLARLAFACAAMGVVAPGHGEVQRLGEARDCPGITHGARCLRLSGWIVADDLKAVHAIVDNPEAAGSKPPFVFLHSRGGDVDAAIALGHRLRRMAATAVVGEDAECLSACVFVLAGAAQRTVAPKAKVGIHQPYLVPSPKRSRSEVRREYDRLSVVARTFLVEMNVPAALYDAMNLVPSDRMQMLSSAELSKYGLNRRDPVWHGVTDASELKRYGLDRNEYLRRKRVSVDQCTQEWTAGQRAGRFEHYFACTERVMAAGGG